MDVKSLHCRYSVKKSFHDMKIRILYLYNLLNTYTKKALFTGRHYIEVLLLIITVYINLR